MFSVCKVTHLSNINFSDGLVGTRRLTGSHLCRYRCTTVEYNNHKRGYTVAISSAKGDQGKGGVECGIERTTPEKDRAAVKGRGKANWQKKCRTEKLSNQTNAIK